MTTMDAPFTRVFARALRGEACAVVGLGTRQELPVEQWSAEADTDDDHLLDHCVGPTLDVGCGPGRLTSALVRRGVDVLGIDVVPEAVGQARERGGPAVRRDVFDPLPREGQWGTVLLADGNIGIGGDPAALLRRTADLVATDGRVVVETGPPGGSVATSWARLECGELRSRPFRWAVVGSDALADLAARAGLRVRETHPFGERWCGVLERAL